MLPPPDVLLESGAIFLMNKPGGLLTQGPPDIDSLELRTKRWLKVRDEKPGKVYLGVPHRLDRPVSGVMVLAKNVRAAKRLADQFRERTAEKKYWAVVEGVVSDDQGTWVDWMRKVPGEARSEVVPEDHEGAKRAVLHYRVRGRSEHRTWLEIELETGRTHQIRLQCGIRQTPILGDALYSATTAFGPVTEDQRQRWIALHARSLTIEHPILHRPVSQVAPLSEYWKVFEDEFGEMFSEG